MPRIVSFLKVVFNVILTRLKQSVAASQHQQLKFCLSWFIRAQWVLPNRLRSGREKYHNFMKEIILSSTGSCKCGADQTASHVLTCTAFGIKGNIAKVNKPLRDWLLNIDLKL